MTKLYLCGAGNPEGVRLALNINQTQDRWDRIIILDDDPSKHGQSILGIEIEGPFSALGQADPASAEVANMVARTTRGRQSAKQKIQSYGLPFAPLIDPGVDMTGVDFGSDITVYRGAQFCANASVDEGSVVFAGAIVGHGCRLGHCCVIAPESTSEIRLSMDIDVKGKEVLLVEDIIDTGRTLKRIKEELIKLQPKRLRIVCLLDKPLRRDVDIHADYVGFTIEDKFVVGYGLDCDEKHRCLSFIAEMKESMVVH